MGASRRLFGRRCDTPQSPGTGRRGSDRRGEDGRAVPLACVAKGGQRNEAAWLAGIEARARGMGARWPQVLVGPGDDCAVLAPAALGAPAGLVTVDQVIETRHFLPPPATTIDQIARKSVARSVSDIAAMGGTVDGGWCVATGLLPHGWAHADELCERLAHWAERFGLPVVGGDLATYAEGHPTPLVVITTTVLGFAHAKRGPVLLSTARPGDQVYVTGKIGGSLASGRHLTFEPRLEMARLLCDRLGDKLHALTDVSDGLGVDAGRIAAASGVRIEMELARVPLHGDVRDPLGAIGDGEDYELVLAAEAGSGEGMEGVTRIGVVKQGAGCVARFIDGREIDVSRAGWSH